MKKIFYLLPFIFLFAGNVVFAQDNPDTTVSAEDTVKITEDSTTVTETDPVKAEISRIIREVNSRSAESDNII